jgi:hypothetical protein
LHRKRGGECDQGGEDQCKASHGAPLSRVSHSPGRAHKSPGRSKLQQCPLSLQQRHKSGPRLRCGLCQFCRSRQSTSNPNRRDDYRVALSRLRLSGIVLMPGQNLFGLPSAWQPRQSVLVFPNHEPPDSIIDFWA